MRRDDAIFCLKQRFPDTPLLADSRGKFSVVGGGAQIGAVSSEFGRTDVRRTRTFAREKCIDTAEEG